MSRIDIVSGARTHAPLDTLDIGQPWSRWPGEPNFENGKLVCPVSTFIRSPSAFLPSFRARRVARGGGGGGDRSGGHFFDQGSSRSVSIGHATLVAVIRDFARRSVGRVASRAVRFDFEFFATLREKHSSWQLTCELLRFP